MVFELHYNAANHCKWITMIVFWHSTYVCVLTSILKKLWIDKKSAETSWSSTQY